MEPGPIPTFTTFAPHFASSMTASGVQTLPAQIVSFGYFLRTVLTMFRTPIWCPCAVSITIISTPASTRALMRSSVFAEVLTAAATRSCPFLSRLAFGLLSRFRMSVIVTRPLSAPVASTSGSFSTRCSFKISFAFARPIFGEAVTGFFVITSRIFTEWSVIMRRSRLVSIPTSFPFERIGKPLTLVSSLVR